MPDAPRHPSRRRAGRCLAALALTSSAGLLVLGAPESAYAESAQDTFAQMAGDDTETISGQARAENTGLAELAASAEQAAAKLAKNAWMLPIASGVYRLTATFGQCSSLWSHCHTGLDFAAPEGTPIESVTNGTVSETGWAGAYGNRTVITADDGTELWYCHQSEIGVKPGQNVLAGQEIGRVGATGNTTGPHLHLEVRPGGGDAVDPQRALTVRGVTP